MQVELSEEQINLLTDLAQKTPLNMNYEGMKRYTALVDSILAKLNTQENAND